MVADDIVAVLEAGGLGLTTGAPTPNLFATPFPENAPDKAVAVDVYGGHPSDRVFGTGKPAVVAEHPSLHVFVRDEQDKDAQAAALAMSVYDLLDGMGPVTLGGVLYRDVRAPDGPPKFLGFDGNLRSVYVVNFDVDKDRS